MADQSGERAFQRLLVPLSLLLLLPGISLPPNNYDEGLIAYNAQLILQGAVPYRDFWTVYAPGQFYLVALLFSVFGKQLIVLRLYDIAVRAGLAVLVYVLISRVASHRAALAGWILALLFLALVNVFGYPIYPALLCALVAGACLFHGRGTAWGAFAAGVAASLAALLRQDVGLYLAAALLLQLLVFERGSTRIAEAASAQSFHPASTQGLHPASAPWRLLFLVLGALPLAGGVGLFLLAKMPAAPLIDQLFRFPLTVFPQVRGIPLPAAEISFAALVVYGSAAMMTALFAATLVAATCSAKTRRSRSLVWVAVLGMLSLLQLRVRPDVVHAVPVCLCVALVLPVAVGRLWSTGGFRQRLFASLAVSYAALFLGVCLVRYSGIVEWSLKALERGGAGRQLAAAWGVPLREDQVAVADRLLAETSATDRLLVIPRRAVTEEYPDLLFYFLTGRNAPTPYAELHPGLGEAADQQLASAVNAGTVRAVVVHGPPPATSTSRETAEPADFPALRSALRKRLVPGIEVGEYQLLEPGQVGDAEQSD